ncbi:MAG: IS200/IS605 family transposase [Saprospiraceae bacterium]|nr:IS200/IS605 family transposase [Saprospiraceae bacterium]
MVYLRFMASKTKAYLHFVFRTKLRLPLLFNSLRIELCEFLRHKAKTLNCEIIAINGYADHIHLLVELDKEMSISDFARILKGSSSRWINSKRVFGELLFRWQRGYYCESVSRQLLVKVMNYIKHQQVKHLDQEVEESLKDLEEFYISLDV